MRVLTAPDTLELEIAAFDLGEDDFVLTRAGELLVPPVFVCHDAEAMHDCGCDRSLTGLTSMRTTTIAVVADVPTPRVERIVRASKLVAEWDGPDEEFVTQQLNAIASIHSLLIDDERVPGDLVRVENGPNDDAFVRLRKAT